MLDLATCRLEYLADKRRENLSPRTLDHYETATLKFLEFVASWDGDVTLPEHVSPRLVKVYIDAAGETLSPGGVHARLRVLRAWMRWMVAEGLLDTSPLRLVRLPSVPQQQLGLVRPAEFRRLVRAAAQSGQAQRDVAILHVLFDTGIRVSELVALDVDDVQSAGLLRVVNGKGARGRLVPVSRTTTKRIASYVKHDRTACPDIRSLFTSRTGEPLTRSGISAVIRRLCRKAGIKPIGPHAFRRGFVVAFLVNEGDPFSAKRILGHTSLTMVDRYAALGVDELKAVHQRASPLAHAGQDGPRH